MTQNRQFTVKISLGLQKPQSGLFYHGCNRSCRVFLQSFNHRLQKPLFQSFRIAKNEQQNKHLCWLFELKNAYIDLFVTQRINKEGAFNRHFFNYK